MEGLRCTTIALTEDEEVYVFYLHHAVYSPLCRPGSDIHSRKLGSIPSPVGPPARGFEGEFEDISKSNGHLRMTTLTFPWFCGDNATWTQEETGQHLLPLCTVSNGRIWRLVLAAIPLSSRSDTRKGTLSAKKRYTYCLLRAFLRV